MMYSVWVSNLYITASDLSKGCFILILAYTERPDVLVLLPFQASVDE